ncbi:hypothetical protein SYNTR_0866 [Candidatus Syntrophocurvum alkaliphilum]|uniref:Alcohol dehydrogenase n=1 Tax=Candidatus Syntrophocurvum alkaliphilum TaxID=2293317 RepID=A0A6I6DAV1_9FIRM|nr:hypothetical protein SYNTR_0866 [Candidatus Syntrophocurvum alkaliphilum]
MKAAILESREKIVIKKLKVPECNTGELLVKVKSCGICRTDMKSFLSGQRDLKLPRILGHEVSGIIEHVGLGVKMYKKGDRVQISPGIPCGNCEFCKKGIDNLCEAIKIMGFNYDGGFAEYILVPANGVKNGIVTIISDNISFEEASMAEPLACSINMQELLNLNNNRTVVIFGLGRLGILNAKLAKLKGSSNIIGVEKNRQRLLNAKKFEFDYIIDSSKADVVKEILSLTSGKGADVVIPCCPEYEAMNTGIQVLTKRGKLGFFSGLITENCRNIDFNLIHYKEISVIGGYGAAIKHSKEALDFITKDSIRVSNMVTKIIGLNDIKKGIDMVKNMTELSVVINFD